MKQVQYTEIRPDKGAKSAVKPGINLTPETAKQERKSKKYGKATPELTRETL
jgi:hypothetical protein